MSDKTEIHNWIWDSYKEKPRVSTYGNYQFISFDDIEGNDFVQISSTKNPGNYLCITIIKENLDRRIIQLNGEFCYRIIFVGCDELLQITKDVASKQCKLVIDIKNAMTFLSPTKTIVEDTIAEIINCIKSKE